MGIDKSKVRTQDQTGESAPMDKTQDRVKAKIKLIESETKEQVAQGLQNDALERKARQQKKEAERHLKATDKARGRSRK
jgi:hypothetical protein